MRISKFVPKESICTKRMLLLNKIYRLTSVFPICIYVYAKQPDCMILLIIVFSFQISDHKTPFFYDGYHEDSEDAQFVSAGLKGNEPLKAEQLFLFLSVWLLLFSIWNKDYMIFSEMDLAGSC